jgi:hypothetical protein
MMQMETVVGPAAPSPLDVAVQVQLPATSLVAHAPGWTCTSFPCPSKYQISKISSLTAKKITFHTVFRNLYMSNGTFFIVSDTPTDFPEIRLMTSTPLTAENNPENIKAREPGPYSMAIVSSSEAQRLWGDDVRKGQKNRVLSVDGNTVRQTSSSLSIPFMRTPADSPAPPHVGSGERTAPIPATLLPPRR